MSAPVATRELTVTEAGRLTGLEAVVERGLETFIEVGTALAEIRDRWLYRATHRTFADYCGERWGMGRSHAYRMIDAAGVAEMVSPNGDTPATEAVARELVPLKSDPKLVRVTWAETVAEHGPQPTAKQVRVKVADTKAHRDRRLGLVERERSPELDRAERAAQDRAVLRLVTLANGAARRVSREREEILGAIERHRLPQNVEVLALKLLFSIRDLQEIADAAMARLDDAQRARVHACLAATARREIAGS